MFNLFGSGHQTVSILNKTVFVRCIYFSSLYLFFKNYFRDLADIGLNFHFTLNMESGWKP